MRQALGVRTVFNILGPLTNPAAPPFALIGAFSAEAAQLMADTLAGMPIERAFVVHGEPGWDEPTPVGPVRAATTCGRAGSTRAMRDPRELRPRTLRGGGSRGRRRRAQRRGRCARCSRARERGPHRDALLLNAALALEVMRRGA